MSSKEISNIRCKCCHEKVTFLGNIDFNKTCEDKPNFRIFDESNILVPYFICNNCDFIFTNFMDKWKNSDFKEKIYNEKYILADPKETSQGLINNSGYDYGKYFTKIILGLIQNKKISKSKNNIKILDYGSGQNLSSFGRALKDNGFYLDSYDPFFEVNHRVNREIRYDFIFMIEVIEHCQDLEKTCITLKELLDENGFLWIQTLLHEINTKNDKIIGGHHFLSAPKNEILNSWYISPRNGHASIFSYRSMKLLFQRHGFKLFKFEEEGILQNLIMAKKMPNGF